MIVRCSRCEQGIELENSGLFEWPPAGVRLACDLVPCQRGWGCDLVPCRRGWGCDLVPCRRGWGCDLVPCRRGYLLVRYLLTMRVRGEGAMLLAVMEMRD